MCLDFHHLGSHKENRGTPKMNPVPQRTRSPLLTKVIPAPGMQNERRLNEPFRF